MGGAQGAYRRDGLPWVRMPYGPGFYVFKGAREDEAVTADSYLDVGYIFHFISCIRSDKQPIGHQISSWSP